MAAAFLTTPAAETRLGSSALGILGVRRSAIEHR